MRSAAFFLFSVPYLPEEPADELQEQISVKHHDKYERRHDDGLGHKLKHLTPPKWRQGKPKPCRQTTERKSI